MEEAVKRPAGTSPETRRLYRSPAREAAAEETRARIRDAAKELFIANGYQGTTLKDVAARAGVGERTLYDSFGNKLGLLRHTIAILTMGDESRVPAADRPAAAAARELDDPRAALAAHLKLGTDLMNRAGDLILVSQANPGIDADLERTIARGTQAAYDVNVRFAQRLASRGELRDGLTAATAADIMFTLTSPGVFHTLRRTRHWGQQRYQDWVVDTATQQLLHDG
ncbi:DNA-binding transcriptional regulator, AcrR family [Pedococcus dokdonensis]|uniref:DNA-binding transcriptional regulator, AcrR family n=1 Tax=Pedococcus dokdonensis TaxID=443156 RepID=A0A1H0TXX6_9MICO|nr:TetR/AcrR family transcriptional regulator [Pedococcus dokdonensis]SDP58887.1 DNA-binding transcriptional regulator, AcrR family [Pedococcus dokdonensis]